MGHGVEWAARVGIAVALLAGCASQPAPVARTPDAARAAPDTAASAAPLAACPKRRKPSRFREMTWAEYYADVKERAWRNAATVIWITPPRVKKPRAGPPSSATACAR